MLDAEESNDKPEVENEEVATEAVEETDEEALEEEVEEESEDEPEATEEEDEDSEEDEVEVEERKTYRVKAGGEEKGCHPRRACKLVIRKAMTIPRKVKL